MLIKYYYCINKYLYSIQRYFGKCIANYCLSDNLVFILVWIITYVEFQIHYCNLPISNIHHSWKHLSAVNAPASLHAISFGTLHDILSFFHPCVNYIEIIAECENQQEKKNKKDLLINQKFIIKLNQLTLPSNSFDFMVSITLFLLHTIF